jgi:hypothetical protein
MPDGLVRIAEYGDEFSAMDAMQYLIDNGIDAKLFNGGVIMYFQRFDLYAPANRAQEAQVLLRDFDIARAQAAGEDAGEDEDDEHHEADCEGNVE